MFKIIILALAVVLVNTTEDNTHWKKLATEDIKRALHKEVINKTAKNVIVFIGDGMGPETITASRIYGKTEKGKLVFEDFQNIALIKTYSADMLVPDSCSTATALFSGVKANQKTSGVDPSVKFNDCEASLNPSAQVDSMFVWAQAEGKSTGFVTTTRVTHATPSALYAHTPNRKWECDNTIPKDGKRCKDIARQLVEDLPGRNIQVIMGGGRQMFQSNVSGSEADPLDTWACYSTDGRDLIEKWTQEKKSRKVSYSVLENSEDLENLDVNKEYVLGVFANGHLKMDYLRDQGPKGMPSLANMTKKAIEVLSKNEKGYVLMVEGGLIDFGHHRGHARQALDETLRFNEAIEVALKITNKDETLIIVTSDHAHSMVFSGYATRKQSILDVAQPSKYEYNNTYTSLLYGTGGPNNYQYEVRNGEVKRPNPVNNDTTSFEYSQQSGVLTDEVTHSGTDVAIYAQGPMAHLFNSVHEQTYVAYVISYAAKIGPFKESDKTAYGNTANIQKSSGAILILSTFIVLKIFK